MLRCAACWRGAAAIHRGFFHANPLPNPNPNPNPNQPHLRPELQHRRPIGAACKASAPHAARRANFVCLLEFTSHYARKPVRPHAPGHHFSTPPTHNREPYDTLLPDTRSVCVTHAAQFCHDLIVQYVKRTASAHRPPELALQRSLRAHDASRRQAAARNVADRPRLHKAHPRGERCKPTSPRGTTANHAQRTQLSRPNTLRCGGIVCHNYQPPWQLGRPGFARQHPNPRADACSTPKCLRPTTF